MPKVTNAPAGNTAVFSDLMNLPKQGASKLNNKEPANAEIKNASVSQVQEEKKPAKETKGPKTGVYFQMTKQFKEQLEDYCYKHDMTITAGIKKAIREMLTKE